MKYEVFKMREDDWDLVALFRDYEDAVDYAAYMYGVKTKVVLMGTDQCLIEFDDV